MSQVLEMLSRSGDEMTIALSCLSTPCGARANCAKVLEIKVRCHDRTSHRRALG